MNQKRVMIKIKALSKTGMEPFLPFKKSIVGELIFPMPFSNVARKNPTNVGVPSKLSAMLLLLPRMLDKIAKKQIQNQNIPMKGTTADITPMSSYYISPNIGLSF